MRIRTFIYCGVVASLFTLTACQSSNTSNNKDVQVPKQSQRNPELWPKLNSALAKDPTTEKRVAEILGKMSLEEKIGQMIQPEIKYATPADIKKYHIGSVLNGGGTFPNNNKHSSPADWVKLANEYYLAAMSGEEDNRIPLIWGSDAVHGHNNVVGATLFPHNIGLGAARDPEMIRRIGAATAKEIATTGVDWTFAPTVAVARDDRWGRTYESYSEDPSIVRQYSKMMIDGLQGQVNSPNFLSDGHVVATAKHFLADGGTHRGIDRGDVKISEEELVRVHAPGFIEALKSGSQTIMASFNSWNGEKVHGSKYLLTDILKQRLGFDGFVVGDWNAHRFVDGCKVDSCPQAVNAGLDMLMVPSDWKPLYNNTLQQARSGIIPISRIDDAVSRILRIKLRAGLFTAGQVTERALAGKNNILGSQSHRTLAREAARKSLVLLKNNNAALPINPTKNILIVGEAATDISRQSGGWTLSWQGTGNKPEDFVGATTIFDGIQRQVKQAGGQAIYSKDGGTGDVIFDNQKPADVIVVVYGEKPYAEWHGDIASIEYQPGSKKDLDLLKKLKRKGVPTVSVFLSGRPLWVNKEINASDAFVAAWLPGSEGEAIADVIFSKANGEVQYDFNGKLSFSWPKFVYQTVLNKGDDDYQPLFPYGYGLNYSDNSHLDNTLNEDGLKFIAGQLDDAWVMVSRTMEPWKFSFHEQGQHSLPVTGNLTVSGEDQNLVISAVDRVSQQDARKIQWLGLKPASISFSSERPQDLSRYQEKSSTLTFDLMLPKKSSAKTSLTMSCGEGCQGSIPLQEVLMNSVPGEWQTVAVDLACFEQSGVDFSKVDNIFRVDNNEPLSIVLSDIKIIPNTADQATISCR